MRRKQCVPSLVQSWSHEIGGDGIEALWHADDARKMLGTVQYSAIFRTKNGGTTWQESLVWDTSIGQFLASIANSNGAPHTVYTIKHDGVHRSTDFGATWSRTSITRN